MNQTLNETGDLDATKAIEQILSLKLKIEEIQDVQRKGEIDQVNHDMQNSDDNDKENANDKDSDAESSEESSPKYDTLAFYVIKNINIRNLFATDACQSWEPIWHFVNLPSATI